MAWWIMGRLKRREPLFCSFSLPSPIDRALCGFPLPSLLKTQRGLGQREERLTVNGRGVWWRWGWYLNFVPKRQLPLLVLTFLPTLRPVISIMNTVSTILTRNIGIKLKVAFREMNSQVYDKRQTSDSSWEFLRIENKQIQTVRNNSYG